MEPSCITDPFPKLLSIWRIAIANAALLSAARSHNSIRESAIATQSVYLHANAMQSDDDYVPDPLPTAVFEDVFFVRTLWYRCAVAADCCLLAQAVGAFAFTTGAWTPWRRNARVKERDCRSILCLALESSNRVLEACLRMSFFGAVAFRVCFALIGDPVSLFWREDGMVAWGNVRTTSHRSVVGTSHESDHSNDNR